ncbi:MAG: YicC/YloC family endoribonuclease [Marinifilaceae bacterium]
MVKSMTGFGKATVECAGKKIVIEVKSLNSKQLDINLRIPNIYREKDIEVRNKIKNKLERGKVDMSIYFDQTESPRETAVNTSAVNQYYQQMCTMAETLGISVNHGDLLQTIMRFPDTLQIKAEELNDDEWTIIAGAVDQALDAIDAFRVQEGAVLITDILKRISTIETLSAQVPQHETRRVETIRQRIEEKMKEWMDVKSIDQNRLEQEIIYYLEKLDITEEKVRLANHCKYFRETAQDEEAPGRKLGFISQEIGREINTMGSKANDHEIQKLVVQMKDELEKIKEQCLNIL